jgi:hypothetical protein
MACCVSWNEKEAVVGIIKEGFLITAVKTDATIGKAIKQM